MWNLRSMLAKDEVNHKSILGFCLPQTEQFYWASEHEGSCLDKLSFFINSNEKGTVCFE